MARLPGHVRSWRRRPLYWLAAMIGLWAVTVLGGHDQAERDRVDYADPPTVTAELLGRSHFWQTVDVAFVDPESGETVRDTIDVYDGRLFPSGDTTAVELELAPGTDREARLAGDVIEFTWEIEIGIALVVPMVIWAILRAAHVAATGRLAAREQPAYRMWGRALVDRPMRARPLLELRPYDQPDRPEPVCTIALVRGDELVRDDREFPCDVKGAPRPFGRLVAHDGQHIVWPAGRAVGWNRRPRPGRDRTR